MKNSIIKIIKNKKTYFVLGIIILLSIWQISSLIINNSSILPSFFVTIKALEKLLVTSSTYLCIVKTIFHLFVTVILCFIISMVLAILSIVSAKFEEMIKPLIVSFKTLPVIVLMLIIWFVFGRGFIPYLLTSLVILPIIYEGILVGLKNVSSDIKDEIALDSKTNIFVICKIYIPISFPFIISSLLQSIGLGLKVIVMAEYLSMSKNTIGYKIYYYAFYELETKMVFAWGIILIVFILLVEGLIKGIKGRIDKIA